SGVFRAITTINLVFRFVQLACQSQRKSGATVVRVLDRSRSAVVRGLSAPCDGGSLSAGSRNCQFVQQDVRSEKTVFLLLTSYWVTTGNAQRRDSPLPSGACL